MDAQMTGTIVEYVAFFSFFLLAGIAVVIETQWLKKRGVVSSRALAHSLVSDIVGFSIGGFCVFVVMGILLVMTLGPSGRGSDASEASYIIVLVIGAFAIPVSLFLVKRLSMLIFKVSTGGSAWSYSFVSAVLTFLIASVPPPVLFYLATRFI